MTTPSAADIEAARLLLGEAPPNTPINTLRVFRVPRSDGIGMWQVEDRIDTRNGGTYLYCPCPAWKFGGKHRCKHTEYVIDMGLVV